MDMPRIGATFSWLLTFIISHSKATGDPAVVRGEPASFAASPQLFRSFPLVRWYSQHGGRVPLQVAATEPLKKTKNTRVTTAEWLVTTAILSTIISTATTPTKQQWQPRPQPPQPPQRPAGGCQKPRNAVWLKIFLL